MCVFVCVLAYVDDNVRFHYQPEAILQIFSAAPPIVVLSCCVGDQAHRDTANGDDNNVGDDDTNYARMITKEHNR